ncbi:glycosyltransferase family protein [Paraliomyxa miuraensis]|uniref:hypothetical protein n=1 Tax=Paraliomyxa miuraensis TaxID=376150 RepID=UPI002257582B|nr:hypothetical protein [Paraliomyxa miuraensis]MCX4247545.1 YfhO family protein [Paraliomyxa miuraensis]
MRRILASFAIAVAAFLVAHPAMLGVGGEVRGPGWDATRVFWADLAFVHHAAQEGSLPLWNPYDRVGYPFVAEPQSGMFDPLTLLLVGLALLLGHAPAWLIMLKSVLCYGIAGSGMAAFLRRLGLPRWAVTLGAAVLVLSPRMDKLKDQSALWPTVWVGWLLLALDRCVARPSWRRGLALGVVGALVIDAGYPPTAFRLLLLLVPYGGWRLWTTVRTHDDRGAYVIALGKALGVALGVVAVLCAAQVWATLGVLPQTQRAQLELAHVLASATHPEHWRGLVAPLPTTTALLMYVGVATAAGMLAALGERPRGRVVTLVAVGAFGFVLACGDNLPVLPALAELPGFRSFRIAGHYLTLVPIVAAIVGALGLARLAQADTPRWQAPVVAIVVLGVALSFTSRDDVLSRVLAVFSALAVAGLGVAPLRWRPGVGWAVVVTLAMELWVVGRPVAEILQPVPDATRSRAMAEALTDRVAYRVADFGWANDRPGPREAVRDLVGHRPALTDPRYLAVYQAAPRSSRMLAAMNVDVVGFAQDVPRRRGGMTAVEDAAPGLYRLRDPWPMAYWTANVAVVGDADEAVDRLRHEREPAAVFEVEHLDEVTSAVVDDLALVPASERPSAVAGRLSSYGINEVVIEIDAPARGLVVVAEGHAEGWTARIDGEPAPLWRANLVFRALVVEPGTHRIELRYEPPGVVALWALWALGWLGIGAVVIVDWRRRRRERAT